MADGTGKRRLRWRPMLVVFGALKMEMVFPVARLPAPGDTVWSGESRLEPGGHAANQALAARRDGARVWLAGALATDGLGTAAQAALAAEGLNLDMVARHEARDGHATGRSATTVDPEGYITVATDDGVGRQARADQVPDWALRPGTVLLVQMETGAEQVARLILRARTGGARVVLNFAPACPLASDALQAVDVLIANSHELAWAGERIGTGNNPASIQAATGIPTVVRMMGPQGAEAFSLEGGFRRMQAHKVQMRDSTGAGDCFVGVFAAALARRETLDMALRRAAVAAALSTTRIGAWSSMPGRAEIDAALSNAPKVIREQSEIED